MIAAWMIYSTGVGALLCAGAIAAEFLCRAFRGPARAAWFGAMIGTIALSSASLFRHAPLSVAATPVEPTAPASIVRYFDRGIQVVEPIVNSPRFTDWNAVFGGVAAFASFAAALYLIAASVRLLRLERQFDRERIEDCEVLVSRDFGPALFGLRRMRIIVPRWVLSLPELDRRLILAHERSHAAAGDPALLVAAMLMLVAQPWNVALWVMFLRLRLAIEMDCDRRVLGAGGDVIRYGKLLISVYQRSTSALALQVAFVERPTNLERRIRRMTSALPKPMSWQAAAAAVAAVTVILVACRAPTPAAKDSVKISITGGGACVYGSPLARIAYASLYDSTVAHHSHAKTDSILGALIDENCNLIADAATPAIANWHADSLMNTMFPGRLQRGVHAGALRMRRDGPQMVFAVAPSKSWKTRMSDECGFNGRSGEVCNLVGSVEMRRLDSRRLLISARGASVGSGDPERDHMFLVTSVTPLPDSLTQSIKFARVIFHGNAVFVENRASTAIPYLFGAAFSRRLDSLPRPMVRFNDLVGIAHYRAPVVTLEEVKDVKPAATCDGPKGACYQVNGRKFEFPA